MGANPAGSHNTHFDKFGNSGLQTCPLCGEPGLLEQDHDHRTDLCRGKVCHGCNVLIGRFDEPFRNIERILAYLRYWADQHATVGGQSYTDYMRELFPGYKRGRRAPRRKTAA